MKILDVAGIMRLTDDYNDNIGNSVEEEFYLYKLLNITIKINIYIFLGNDYSIIFLVLF